VSPRRSRPVARSAPVALTAAIDRGRRLSEGSVVQASIRARLLGMPLLRLDATVVLAPATITSSSSGGIGRGDSLAEAVRDINDGAEILAEIRRNGT
jgi:hypothetical protein